jgi:hypothetical protein
MWELKILAVATNLLLWTQGQHYDNADACRAAALQLIEPGKTYVDCSKVLPVTGPRSPPVSVGFTVGE